MLHLLPSPWLNSLKSFLRPDDICYLMEERKRQSAGRFPKDKDHCGGDAVDAAGEDRDKHWTYVCKHYCQRDTKSCYFFNEILKVDHKESVGS